MDAFERFRRDASLRAGLPELYVAPMYNLLIQDGADIRYSLVDLSEVVFCGVPDEYDAFLLSNTHKPG